MKAVDNKGATSLAGYAKLGVSGWETEIVTSDTVSTVEFSIKAMGFDPVTGELVVAGAYGGDHGFPITEGIYFARLKAGGTWEKELVIAYDAPEWHYSGDATYGGMGSCFIGWNAGGQPIPVINAVAWGRRQLTEFYASKDRFPAYGAWWTVRTAQVRPLSFPGTRRSATA